MAVTCKNCGGAHAIWECKRPATKSTGAAKVAGVAPKLAHGSRDQLPVDTTSTRVAHKGSAAASAEGVSSILTPGAKFDKKAWSRAYMKIWMRNKRAKLKARPGA